MTNMVHSYNFKGEFYITYFFRAKLVNSTNIINSKYDQNRQTMIN